MLKLTETSLARELDLSSWIMWTAEGMRQSLLIATTMELVTTAVHIFKMQEWYVNKVMNVVFSVYALTLTRMLKWSVPSIQYIPCNRCGSYWYLEIDLALGYVCGPTTNIMSSLILKIITYQNSVHLACKHSCNDSTIRKQICNYAAMSLPSTPEATSFRVSTSAIGGSVGGALIVIIILLVLVVLIAAVVVKRKKAAVQSFHTG